MSDGIKVAQDVKPAQKANGLEGVYRALASSKRQKLFEKVLNQAQHGGKDVSGRENYSLDSSVLDTQTLHPNGVDPERARTSGTPAPRESANSLATSTLLSLTALTSGGSGLNGAYLKSIGIAASGSSSPTSDPAPAQSARSSADSREIGSLSARFESGENGIATIGYDDRGGTSYGMYQIASRPGTMRSFLDYLQEKAPRMAARLRAAGPANTGGRNGAMPNVWKQLASEDAERFAALQRDFIQQTHYLPAIEEIRDRTGINLGAQPQAIQEALWSTAVQHGPKGAANIFCKAISRIAKPGQEVQAKDLVNAVYSSRGRQFGASSASIRSAVQDRFQEEKSMVLAMLDQSPSRAEA